MQHKAAEDPYMAPAEDGGTEDFDEADGFWPRAGQSGLGILTVVATPPALELERFGSTTRSPTAAVNSAPRSAADCGR